MRKKLLTWSGKYFVFALFLLAGLSFSQRIQAQTLTTATPASWYDQPTATTLLTQEILTLDLGIQSPTGTPSLSFMKYKQWYYQEVLTTIQGGETVSRAVEISQNKVAAVLQPDTPNPDLTAKEISDLFQSAVTLLTY